MPHPRAPFDGGGVQAVDRQFFADFLQHAEINFAQAAVGGGGVTGKRIGGFIQPFGQRIADQAEQGIKAVFHLEQIKHGLRDLADTVGIVIGKHRHVIDHALNGNHFGCAQLFVRGRGGDHHSDQRILGG